ncbi:MULTISPECIES: MurR/RpiR family transcriptional regulator [unclassified Streptomyces]|uniref:MurR/RpiR family transcriptional regulator n=1 Tax=unclassified Streptomyces TaxID=2593676 RepID=UPI0006B02704|nr:MULTISPECIES: MurR/RpiR family transcriptional regulator [unclassified Streptomyces]KOX23331.1 RpiR family transcriptional regulator [Streptomyces sp. NRRL F-6491]KOX42717.1 RpiR family transcriptional regulator [Streptomyces sp. NRRL F-6492]
MSPTLADEIRDRLGDLSPAERKVARVLLAGYPAAVFETVATIAARASVSAPTVLRCASRLGYKGFPDLQAALRLELDARTASPITLYETSGSSRHDAPDRSEEASGPRLGERLALVQQAVSQTFKEVAPQEFGDAVRLLSDPRRRVHVAGGRFTHLLARYLGLHLTQFRDQVSLFPDRDVERASFLTQLARRDVTVLFDYRRYEADKTVIAELARERGGKVIVFTDPWLSPAAAHADVVLVTQVTSDSPYDSLTPALALIESLVAAVLDRVGGEGHERMKLAESVARRTGLL